MLKCFCPAGFVIHQEGLRIQKLTCCASAKTMPIWHNRLVRSMRLKFLFVERVVTPSIYSGDSCEPSDEDPNQFDTSNPSIKIACYRYFSIL